MAETHSIISCNIITGMSLHLLVLIIYRVYVFILIVNIHILSKRFRFVFEFFFEDKSWLIAQTIVNVVIRGQLSSLYN